MGHVRFYEAGNTYDMPKPLAHAAAQVGLLALTREWSGDVRRLNIFGEVTLETRAI